MQDNPFSTWRLCGKGTGGRFFPGKPLDESRIIMSDWAMREFADRMKGNAIKNAQKLNLFISFSPPGNPIPFYNQLSEEASSSWG